MGATPFAAPMHKGILLLLIIALLGLHAANAEDRVLGRAPELSDPVMVAVDRGPSRETRPYRHDLPLQAAILGSLGYLQIAPNELGMISTERLQPGFKQLHQSFGKPYIKGTVSDFVWEKLRGVSIDKRYHQSLRELPKVPLESMSWTQHVLTLLRFGSPDLSGKNNVVTETSLRSFQRSRGLEPTGFANLDTYFQLLSAYDNLLDRPSLSSAPPTRSAATVVLPRSDLLPPIATTEKDDSASTASDALPPATGPRRSTVLIIPGGEDSPVTISTGSGTTSAWTDPDSLPVLVEPAGAYRADTSPAEKPELDTVPKFQYVYIRLVQSQILTEVIQDQQFLADEYDINARIYHRNKDNTPKIFLLCIGPYSSVKMANSENIHLRELLPNTYSGLLIANKLYPWNPEIESTETTPRNAGTGTVDSASPIATPSTATPAKRTPVISTAKVYQLQRSLTRLGYAPGPVDGRLGPKTISALQAFQADQGLSNHGRLDKETNKRLFSELRMEAHRRKRVASVRYRSLDPSPPPPFKLKQSDKILAMESIECKPPHEAWLLLQSGSITSLGKNEVTFDVSKRIGLYYDRRKSGESSKEWWCIPRLRYCYGDVPFGKWKGVAKKGDSVTVNSDNVFPQAFGPKMLAFKMIEQQCKFSH